MNASMGQRLVKIYSASDETNTMPMQSEKRLAGKNPIAKRFIDILLSCLSAWGT